MVFETLAEDLRAGQLRHACTDLTRRLRAGETCRTEDLLTTYPALACHQESALELLYTEFVVREQLGQQPEPTEWYARFPQWQHDLQQVFQIHGFVCDTSQQNGTRPPETPGQAAELPTSRIRGERALAGGKRVGNYELFEEVGRGGMGVVYRARQAGLNRMVALKMILAGSYAQPADLGRFRTEAQATARLQHPNIVQVYEVGEQDGQPYLALEWVDGGSLSQRLATAPLPPADAARLVETLARAIQFAHERGVLHRDLKPANILLRRKSEIRSPKSETNPKLEEANPKPQGREVVSDLGTSDLAFVSDFELRISDFDPKVTDFGLAKRLDSAVNHTQTGSVVGTPSYMAPEQAEGKRKEAGPATDVYALGAVLYECLTGRPPFKAETAMETLLQVKGQEPVSPRGLQPKVPRDLETICLKCLHKEPRKRYATALELAEDLRRFGAGESIRARPVTAWERAGKWARRRPAVAALLGVVVLLTVLGLSGVAWQWYRAEVKRQAAETAERNLAQALRAEEEARQSEETQRQETERHLYHRLITLAHLSEQSQNLEQADQYLNECSPALRQWEWHYLKRQCRPKVVTLDPRDGPVHGVTFDPDGRRLWTGSNFGLKLWDSNSGKELGQWVLPSRSGGRQNVAFSSDRRRLAVSLAGSAGVKVYDAVTCKELQTLSGTAPVVFSPDGQRLASRGIGLPRTIKVCEVKSGQELQSWPADSMITSLAFSTDGRLLASGGTSNTIHVYDTTTGRQVLDCRGHTNTVTSLAYRPDGRQLASASSDKTVRIWDTRTGAILRTLCGHTQGVTIVQYSPDGKHLASVGGDRIIRFWDATSGQEPLVTRMHADPIHSLAFAPDGRCFACGGLDGTVRIWPPAPRLKAHFAGHAAIAFQPDGRCLAAGMTHLLTIGLHDAETGQQLHTLTCETYARGPLALSSNGNRLVMAALAPLPAEEIRRLAPGKQGMLVKLEGTVWDTSTGRKTCTIPAGSLLAIGSDGRRLLHSGAGQKGRVTLWDVDTGQELHAISGRNNGATGAFTPDGRSFAVAGRDGRIAIWDTGTGRELLTIRAEGGGIRNLAFSTDGRRLATVGPDRMVQIWDVATGQLVQAFRGHSAPVLSVAFHPHGHRLVSGDQGKTIKLWDVGTGQEVLSLNWDSRATQLVFSPDGARLAAACTLGSVQVWDATPLQEN